jgi:hypothetical protein
MGTKKSRIEKEHEELLRRGQLARQRGELIKLKHTFLPKKVEDLRRQYGVPSGGFKDYRETLTWWSTIGKQRINDWSADITDLRERLELAPYSAWYTQLEAYVLTDNLVAPLLSLEVHVEDNQRSVRPTDEITDTRDLKYIESFLQSDRQFANKAKHTRKINLALHQRIHELSQEGLKDSQIAKVITDEFLHDSSLAYSASDIADKRKKFQKRLSRE